MPLDFILSQVNPVHTLKPYIFKIHFNNLFSTIFHYSYDREMRVQLIKSHNEIFNICVTAVAMLSLNKSPCPLLLYLFLAIPNASRVDTWMMWISNLHSFHDNKIQTLYEHNAKMASTSERESSCHKTTIKVSEISTRLSGKIYNTPLGRRI